MIRTTACDRGKPGDRHRDCRYHQRGAASRHAFIDDPPYRVLGRPGGRRAALRPGTLDDDPSGDATVIPGRQARISQRRSARSIGFSKRLAMSLASGVVLLAASGASANAYTVLGATFVLEHGAPGARIVVVGLPLAVDCPSVDVWLVRGAAPSPPVTERTDPRLLKLSGAVRVRRIGAGGAGDTRPATTFEFRVPAIQPGIYATYAECRGSSSFEGFEAGATSFTVDPGAPSTDVESAAVTRGFSPPLPPLLPVIAGLLTIPCVELWSRRLNRRR